MVECSTQLRNCTHLLAPRDVRQQLNTLHPWKPPQTSNQHSWLQPQGSTTDSFCNTLQQSQLQTATLSTSPLAGQLKVDDIDTQQVKIHRSLPPPPSPPPPTGLHGTAASPSRSQISLDFLTIVHLSRHLLTRQLRSWPCRFVSRLDAALSRVLLLVPAGPLM